MIEDKSKYLEEELQTTKEMDFNFLALTPYVQNKLVEVTVPAIEKAYGKIGTVIASVGRTTINPKRSKDILLYEKYSDDIDEYKTNHKRLLELESHVDDIHGKAEQSKSFSDNQRQFLRSYYDGLRDGLVAENDSLFKKIKKRIRRKHNYHDEDIFIAVDVPESELNFKAELSTIVDDAWDGVEAEIRNRYDIDDYMIDSHNESKESFREMVQENRYMRRFHISQLQEFLLSNVRHHKTKSNKSQILNSVLPKIERRYAKKIAGGDKIPTEFIIGGKDAILLFPNKERDAKRHQKLSDEVKHIISQKNSWDNWCNEIWNERMDYYRNELGEKTFHSYFKEIKKDIREGVFGNPNRLPDAAKKFVK